MQCRVAEPQPVAVAEHIRMMRLQLYGLVMRREEHCAVRRTQVLDKECIAFAPYPCVTTRDLGLRIVTREIDLRKDVRHRVASPNKIVRLLERVDRRIKLARSLDHELCRPGDVHLPRDRCIYLALN